MGRNPSEEDKMSQLDDFKPFDTQTLQALTFDDMMEMKRIINVLVKEVQELKK